MAPEERVERPKKTTGPVAAGVLLYLGTAVGTGLLAFLYSSVLPGLPWSEDCGMQFVLVPPIAVGLLLMSVPTVIVADRLRLRGFLKWYAPTTGLLSLGAWMIPEVALAAPLPIWLVVWSALSVYGLVAVARLIGYRWRSA